ncbi:MAG: amidohydrolase [Rhodocyclaceae bacterium]|nr:amidohydrolase [Rhodocyclaceae bacterium]
MSLDTLLPDLAARIAAVRRDIHAHPELAFKENRTADVVADYLENLGIEVHRGLAGTGVVAKISAGSSSRAIGLRADMDALPLKELNTFPHHSRIDGHMHACGHDGHTAMLLGAAEALAKTRNFDGTVYLIFQPAEEHEGGGRVMVEEGLFDRFPMDMVFGLHNWPGLEAGKISVIEGPVMAGTDRFEITVTGRGGHAAMPHQANDAVIASAALITNLQTLVSRNTDPQEATVVSVTRIHAGHADNILPNSVVMGGTVRTLKPELKDMMEAGVRRICTGVEAMFGVEVNLVYSYGYPPTVNAKVATDHARAVAAQVVGKPNLVTHLKASMGAEDFAYMAAVKPGCYVWLGNGMGEGGCMLHSPHYDFNDEVIPTGIRYWVTLAETVLARKDG